MGGLHFVAPYLLILLVIVPAAGVYLLRTRNRAAALVFGTAAPAAGLPRTWRIRLEPLVPALHLTAIALLIIALARPQRGLAVTASSGEGIDIVLALDASSSMSQPFSRNRNRLQAAQEVLKTFVQARTRDRVGLVAFRETSITLSPLTTDYHAISASLDEAGQLRLADGTAIGLAIAESVNTLRTSAAKSRIVILLTDGENNVHEIEPVAAARLAQTLGIRVYTVGVVSPDPNPGRSTLSVDERSLGMIASVTGGTYSRAENQAALQAIYSDIEALERSRFEDRRFTHYDDVAPYILAAAAAALALALVLASTVFRRAV